MSWSEVVFIVSFLGLVHFLRASVRAWRSPELKADLERLREMRRRKLGR